MNKGVSNYINFLCKKESIFPIDSFPKVRKRVPITDQKTETFKRAMIDLDGTIHKYSKGYQDGSLYDDVFDGAREVINWLRDNGFNIVIFTTRASVRNAEETNTNLEQQIEEIKNYLRKHNIYFDEITGDKLAADFYIDDKAIHIPNGDWDYVKSEILKRTIF